MSPLIYLLAAGAAYLLLKKKEPTGFFPPPTTTGPIIGPTSTQPPAERPPAGPPSLGEQSQAKELAPIVAEDILRNGRGTNRVVSGVLVQGTGYNQERLKTFQRLARLTVDGLYGPKSAGALAYFLERDAPPAIYSDAQGRRTPVRYAPPTS